MDNKTRGKIKRNLFSNIFSNIPEELYDESEKDYIRLKYPKEFVISNYNRINKFTRMRNDELTSLGYLNTNEKEIDIILNSQKNAKEKVMEYCRNKYFIEGKKGISVGISNLQEMICKIKEKIADENKKYFR